jgi:hypothetical protein
MRDNQKVDGFNPRHPRIDFSLPQVKDDPDLWVIAHKLAQIQAAGAFAAVGAVNLFTELTLKFSERTTATLFEAAVGPSKSDGSSTDGAANEAMSLYRDYVREMAALPGIVGMRYFEHLDRNAPKS